MAVPAFNMSQLGAGESGFRKKVPEVVSASPSSVSRPESAAPIEVVFKSRWMSSSVILPPCFQLAPQSR